MADTTSETTTPSIRFTAVSRPFSRFSNTQTISNLTASSFQPIPLAATGWVRKIRLLITQTVTSASAGAVVAGDGPFNLISAVTLTDATGQPIFTPISGYNLYLLNKYFGTDFTGQAPSFKTNPHQGAEYAYSSTTTTGTASFRLDLDLEIDPRTGYGCIPNLDANASLQLKVDVSSYAVAFSGTTVSAANISLRTSQWYWPPVAATTAGTANMQEPPGAGDYLETRLETKTLSASSENLTTLVNKGGLIKGLIMVSRNAGTRTAITAGTNVGLVYDNTSIDEGIPLEEHNNNVRRTYGYTGTDITTSYAPLTAGTMPGLDTGVLVWNFDAKSPTRDAWLNTKVGALLQARVTPGASATQADVITQIAQVSDASAFYA